MSFIQEILEEIRELNVTNAQDGDHDSDLLAAESQLRAAIQHRTPEEALGEARRARALIIELCYADDDELPTA